MGRLHFLDVGFGDTSLISAQPGVLLIDCLEIEKHSHLLPGSGNLTALFVTHQHYDHFLGMKYLAKNRFKIDYLICSPYERRHNDTSVEHDEWWEFEKYASFFQANGTKIYKPYRQDTFSEPWWEVCGTKIWLLGPIKHVADKETRELHDACLVFLAQMGARKCLFTGDASDESLNWIASNTSNICGDILHASHHGSINGADLEFIKKCDASYTVISTKSGVKESVPHPTALRRYKENTKHDVLRTDIDGSFYWDF